MGLRLPSLAVAAGFSAGALPLSYVAARYLVGADLRRVGSGTVSGTGLARVAGTAPLVVVGVFEVAKGAVGPMLAGREHPAWRAVSGAAGVAGHNWSPLLRGAGGRGISPAIGALLVSAPAGSLVLLVGLVLGRAVGETALGCLVADVALVPVAARAHGRRGAAAAAAVLVPMLAKRLMGNSPRRHTSGRAYLARLLFDRDTFGPPGQGGRG